MPTVHIIKTKDSEEIQVVVKEFREQKYVDIRVHFRVDGEQTMVPSKKGITFRAQYIDEVMEALKKAQETVSA